MLRIEQHFRPGDLEPVVNLIEAIAEEVDIRAAVTQSVRVILPERRRSVCVSMSWGGGVPATNAFFDLDLNESLRMHRCIVPFTRLIDGSDASDHRTEALFLGAGLLCWSAKPAIETCVLLGCRRDDTALSPLAIAPTFARMWIHGKAPDDLIRLLQGQPWSVPSDGFATGPRSWTWDHLPLGRYRATA